MPTWDCRKIEPENIFFPLLLLALKPELKKKTVLFVQDTAICHLNREEKNMTILGNLLATAMAVMPHTDVDQALKTALSLDIPFWPQLPNYSYYEDMYVQAAEHFPGIVLDLEKKTLRFSLDKFIAEFEDTMAHFEEPAYFDASTTYSVVYHKFLDLELSDRPAPARIESEDSKKPMAGKRKGTEKRFRICFRHMPRIHNSTVSLSVDHLHWKKTRSNFDETGFLQLEGNREAGTSGSA